MSRKLQNLPTRTLIYKNFPRINIRRTAVKSCMDGKRKEKEKKGKRKQVEERGYKKQGRVKKELQKERKKQGRDLP